MAANANSFRLRPAEPRDHRAVVRLARILAEEGDAFPWDETVTDEALADFWLPSEHLRLETIVAESDADDGSPCLAGAAVVGPVAGRGSGCAYIAFAVHPALRRHGLGKHLCQQCLDLANRRGYTGVRLDGIVSENLVAVKILAATGFKVMCTLPKAFRHAQKGQVDTLVMYASFDIEAPSPARPPRPSGTSSATSPPRPTRESASSPKKLRAALQLAYQTAAAGGEGGRSGAESADGGFVLSVREEVYLEPHLGGFPCGGGAGGVIVTYAVEPALPEGLVLEPTSGAITGVPTKAVVEGVYHVTATVSMELRLQVDPEREESEPETLSCGSRAREQSLAIDQDFADRLQQVTDVEQLRMVPAPVKTRAYGNWMIWMVHRAFLNDETLVELDFSNMEMPPGHIEKFISPKLCAAMTTNTHLEVLSLSNANFQKPEAAMLAESLKVNTTLLELNLESNWLDSNAVRELALAIHANSACRLEHFRVSHQKQMGTFFGRPTEEAIGQMMQHNETIVKLGFECKDAHWRNLIDRSLVRNNDSWRRRQQGPEQEDLPPPEEKTLSHVMLQGPPDAEARGLFRSDSAHLATYQLYVAQNSQLPTTAQLQSFAKNAGRPVPYNMAAPVVKECRAQILNVAKDKAVVIVDAFAKHATGVLKDWSEANEQWSIEVWTHEGQRLLFKSQKEPGFSVSAAWSKWFSGGSEIRRPSIAGA